MKKKAIILSVFITTLFLVVPLFADASARTKKYTGTVLYRSGNYIKIKVGSTQYKVKVNGARVYTNNGSGANINSFSRNDRVRVTGKYSEADKILTASKVTILTKVKRPNTIRVTVKSFNKNTNTITAKKKGTVYTITYNENTIFLTKDRKKSNEDELKKNKSFYFYGTLRGTKMTAIAQIRRKK